MGCCIVTDGGFTDTPTRSLIGISPSRSVHNRRTSPIEITRITTIIRTNTVTARTVTARAVTARTVALFERAEGVSGFRRFLRCESEERLAQLVLKALIHTWIVKVVGQQVRRLLASE